MMNLEDFSIQEFLGMILVAPVIMYVSFILLKFISDIRDYFNSRKR